MSKCIFIILGNQQFPLAYLSEYKNDHYFIMAEAMELCTHYKYHKQKIKVEWLSNKILKEKIYRFKPLKNWKPYNSKIKDVVKIITG